MIRSTPATVREFLFQEFLPARFVAPSTLALWPVVVNRLDRWAERPVRLDELTAPLLTAHLRAMLADHSPVTVNNQRRRALQLWRAAHDAGYCDPPGKVPKVREPEPEPEAWTVEEFGRLIAECRKLRPVPRLTWRADWWTSLWLTVYWTGARIGSLLAAGVTDYSEPQQELRLRARTQKNSRGQRFRLSGQAAAWVGRILLCEPGRTLLWPWDFNRSWLWREARRIVEAAGLPCPHESRQLFHRARRTCLSYCAATDPAIAQRQAGHASLTMTSRHYLDQRICGQRTAADVLPELHF